ncbi:universal stress protein [Hymenobacter sp. BT770]|uniref:universal stress protein n=1 Tax=Hymenobacter sp. BT770 TaxID=2886942 RepID=UPI001D1128BA|nr:universal stress protein [Hymenobacter sp. BT770]MCC3154109.1 universal stress protein [Hymenobacter sp. BT770]MDO3416253.1 universal stress protein [Hymenobacter sp. BT770]
MNLSTILCPLDFSAASSGLVAYAAALAVATGAELRLLHVCEPQEDLAGRLPGAPASASPVPCIERLTGFRADAEQAGAAHVHTGIVQGEAASEIIAEASRQKADLIVIGAHGQTGLTRFLMGSTAEIVLRTAPCATLLVRASHQPENGK